MAHLAGPMESLVESALFEALFPNRRVHLLGVIDTSRDVIVVDFKVKKLK